MANASQKLRRNHNSIEERAYTTQRQLQNIGTQFSGHSDQINKVLQQQTHQMDVMTERVDGKDMVIHELRERLQDKDDMIAMLKNEVVRLKADEAPKKNKNASS
jgi:chromosome segregation ATPase